MCNILNRLIVERNGRKSGTRGTTVHIGSVLLMPDSSLAWFGVIRCTLAKFPILQLFFKNSAPLPNFIQFIQTLYSISIIQAVIFLAIGQQLQNLWHFEILLLLQFSKCYFSHNFHWTPPKLYDNIVYHGKSKCLLEYEKLASST